MDHLIAMPCRAGVALYGSGRYFFNRGLQKNDQAGWWHNYFKKAGINLSKIESRPSKRKAWEYIFFIDMEGHVEDSSLTQAVEEMKEDCLFLKILGSYPGGE